MLFCPALSNTAAVLVHDGRVSRFDAPLFLKAEEATDIQDG